jgi:S-phase kinase-associated protein 1
MAEVKGLDAGGGDEEVVRLKSRDGKVFEVPRKAAMMSTLVRTALESDHAEREIALDLIDSGDVAKVVEYLNYHARVPPREIERPIPSTNLRDFVDEWDANFAEVDQDTLFRVLLAANYLDIKPLLMLMAAKTASLMKGRTPEEIRKTFNIRSDYTPEDEEAVRREYRDLLE